MASFNFVCHSINKPRKKHQTSNPVKDNEPRKKKKKKTTNPKKTHTQTDKQPINSRSKFKPSFNIEFRPIQATHRTQTDSSNPPIQPCFLIFYFFIFIFLWVWDEEKKQTEMRKLKRKKKKKERLNERKNKEERKLKKRKKKEKESESKVAAGRSLGVCLITEMSLSYEWWKQSYGGANF